MLLEEQVDWIRWHHERADGRGYPDGRLAAEIPEGAALLAIADAFDVMTVSRPYGPPDVGYEAVESAASPACSSPSAPSRRSARCRPTCSGRASHLRVRDP